MLQLLLEADARLIGLSQHIVRVVFLQVYLLDGALIHHPLHLAMVNGLGEEISRLDDLDLLLHLFLHALLFISKTTIYFLSFEDLVLVDGLHHQIVYVLQIGLELLDTLVCLRLLHVLASYGYLPRVLVNF